MAMYDLPKQLELVQEKTGKKIAFVGHSMGSTAAAIYAAMKPEHARRHINILILTSIGGLFKNVKVPFADLIGANINVIYVSDENKRKNMFQIEFSFRNCLERFGITNCSVKTIL